MLVSVYVRKADEELWRKLPHKTEAISKLLRGQQLSGIKIVETFKPGTHKVPGGEVIVPGPTSLPKEFQPKFCKNGHPIPYPKDKCLGKGCKYA